MKKLVSLLTLLLITITSCKNGYNQSFSVTIKHYAGAAGLTLIYDINETGLKVETNCDLENCKQQTVYERTFTQKESDSIYKFIISLRLDTLKPAYEAKGIMDGLFTTLSFKHGFFSSHTSTFNNFRNPTTDTLFIFVDNLVATKKYKFHHWGESD